MTALSVLGLSGCVSQNQVTLAAPPPAPRPIMAAAPPVQNGGPRTINRTVATGTTALLDEGWSINPDCTSRTVPIIRVLQQPAHGTARVSTRDDYPHFPPVNPRSACNTIRLPAAILDYTPTQGFVGPDLLSYEIITGTGVQSTVVIVITVK
jgi:hypothetical protein